MATRSSNVGSDLTVLTTYVSPDGPSALDARGILLSSSMLVLKHGGQYERYLENLSTSHREQLTGALAASWVPMPIMLAHCHAIDSIGLTDSQLQQHGEELCEQIAASTFGPMMRAARNAGLENAVWFFFSQVDRLWPRVFRGGGCAVLKVGPKDAIFEAHGLPTLGSRFYRTAHHAVVLGLLRSFTKSCYVKAVRPRDPHPQRTATAMSWV